jgi:hypothetical protein
LENCIVRFRDLDTMEIGAEVFGELRNVVLEINREGKMVRESIYNQVITLMPAPSSPSSS